MIADSETNSYFEILNSSAKSALNLANEARAKSIDPSDEVEVTIANNLGERVEGLLKIKGIKEELEILKKNGLNREETAFELTRKIARGEILQSKTKEEAVEKAVRVGVAILTEGVLVAPTEGISKVKILKDEQGSEYIALFYAGPIRSAGGTIAALSAVLGDLARRELNIPKFKPSEKEIARIIEETNIYDSRCARLQYKPSEEHIEIIARNCPVCIDGDPTEEVEVSVNRNIPRIESNRVRSGVPLVMCEGIAQKAQKLSKYIKKLGIDNWEWLEKIMKIKKKEEKVEIKEDWTYLEGVVAGRPIFAYPSTKGGFRLRYGRARTTGLMAKGIHPATMVITDDFLANGTHIKIERPGKGAVVSSVDSIDGPIVKLKNGSVIQLKNTEQAKSIKSEIEEILFIGDLLTTFGDFHKTNTPLLPSPYVEEWWILEAKEKGINTHPKTAREAFEISKKYELPLHPKFLFYWNDITKDMLISLFDWLSKSDISIEFNSEYIKAKNSIQKRILELIGIEHELIDNIIIVKGDNAFSLANTLRIYEKENIGKNREIIESSETVLEALSKISGIEIRNKSGTYIGARMGRPEKAKEREMDGSPNVLFPSGDPKVRSLTKLYNSAKAKNEKFYITSELARFKCPVCNLKTYYRKCSQCGAKCILERTCKVCGKATNDEKHCGKETIAFETTKIDLSALYEEMKQKFPVINEIKGVKGLSNKTRIPERLEKGFLRAKHNVFIFRDGTCRFDASDVPISHFTPKEIGASVSKLRELGYSKDITGKELENENQLLALKVQDLILSENAANYMIRVANFIDDLLVYVYGLKPFYNIKSKSDLIGHLFISLAPHISTGILSRAIGFTKAEVFYAHPFMHAAKRRNCDGDEDSIMLLMDAFLNFSLHYLSESRGNTMDSPIVLTLNMDPNEIDDEAHSIEVEQYNLDFYKATLNYSNPSEVKIKRVSSRLGTETQYNDLGITHLSSSIEDGNNITAYKKLKSIPEKIDSEITLMKKIRAVNLKNAIEKIVLDHFIPDIYGNLRKFSKQQFRCVSCQAKYRRVPLKGTCVKCNGNLVLTIHKKGIEKYLQATVNLAEKYDLPMYLKQRLKLVKQEIESLFEDDKIKQTGMFDFV